MEFTNKLLTSEIIKKHLNDKDHGRHVEKLSLLLFEKMTHYFPYLEKYNNTGDLDLLKKGAVLHDIGINFEDLYKKPHNKAGALFIYENKPEDINQKDLILICCLIRYHRKNPPKKKHKFYKMLSTEDKHKMKIFASVIKLADAMDHLHIGLVEDFVTIYDKDNKLLTLIFADNIISNRSYINAIKKKKTFFEKVFDVRIELKGNKG